MIYKFNGGRGAVLCSGCGVILYEGSTIPKEIRECFKDGKKPSEMPDFYCYKCEELKNK